MNVFALIAIQNNVYNVNESDLKICAYFFGKDFLFGKKYHSVFRDNDPNPSLVLYISDDKKNITFYDFGKGKLKFHDCTELLRLHLEFVEKRRVTRNEARDFARNKLGAVSAPNINQINVLKSISPTIIHKNYYSTWELGYWSKFEQTIDTLILEDIYGLDRFYYNENFPLISEPGNPRFLYVLENGGWKVYSPYDAKNKFKSGSIFQCIEGWNTLPEHAEELWIDASTKDRLCMKLLFEAVINPTNEGSFKALISRKEEIDSRFYRINVCFDNDAPGRAYTQKLCDLTGWNPVILNGYPKDYELKNTECKDKARVVELYDSGELKKLFIKNKYL